MNMPISELLSSIEAETNESEICVLESMLMSYVKTYDMLINGEESEVIQEAVFDFKKNKKTDKKISKDKKEEKDGVISKIIKTIIEFFKSIGRAIASFFSKTKDKIVERIRKFSKSKDASDEAVNEAQEKANKISEEKSESLNKLRKKELVDNDEEKSKDKKKSGSTGVIVKERKIRTCIKFSNWISSLTETNEELDNFINNKFKITKTRLKDRTIFLYHFFPHKYPASDVADYVEKIIELFKQVNIKLDKASKIMDEVQKTYTAQMEAINSSDKYPNVFKKMDRDSNKEIERGIRNMSEFLFIVGAEVQNMTSYLASELGIYGIILDTIEPVLSKHKAEDEEKEAKKKAEEREARTQHIDVHVNKDDE